MVRDFVTDLRRTPDAALSRRRLRKSNLSAVGYIGWVGHDNLGDEAMFQVVRKALNRFAVLDLLPEPGERLLTQLGLGGADVFRAVLLGGGTLINPLYLPLARMVRNFRLPLYTVGTGVGNPGLGISSPDNSLEGWKDLLGNSPLISVRGPLSQHLLQQAGITQGEIIGDPALGFTPEAEPLFRRRRRLVINLTDVSHHGIFRLIGQLIRQFLESGGEVVGVALGSGDRKALEAFCQENRITEMKIEDHRRSAEGLLRTLEGSYALISVRLHAAVLASCVGVPPLLMAYRSKCEDFMSSMGLKWFAVPLSSGEAGTLRLEECFAQILSEPDLCRQIYRKALFWKGRQQEYYSRLLAQIEKVMTSQPESF
jgi:polysaccharide pyruvyl transferase WcaK-like protein